jgi:hypothetical protein
MIGGKSDEQIEVPAECQRMWTVREPERKIDPFGSRRCYGVSRFHTYRSGESEIFFEGARMCKGAAVPVPMPVRMPSDLFSKGCCGGLCDTVASPAKLVDV